MTSVLSLPASMLIGALLVSAPILSATEPSSKIDFNRDIRPLFSTHCTACHGGVKSAGGISFVYRDKTITKGKSGEVAVVPGKPMESALIKRVTSTDADEVMPKPDHGPRLSDHDIALLTNWIEQGAVWSEHWSFVPPVESQPPRLAQGTWPRSRVDEWVLARLESEGLAPAQPAGNAEWLRRVSLDLIGLPPTIEEFEAFDEETKINAVQAREHVVDRLLKSGHFGERWASMWLDLARYADTFGFEKDPNRDIWPWRDWVVRAFNADMPFDQFSIKQLAGDLLPAPTGDDMLATAFHRNTQCNTEGGTDDEEFRTAAVLDRVRTTWTAWQATTFGCTQCHAHPYDPFPHDDFYRFAAFFNNTEDTDLADDFPRFTFDPDIAKEDEMALQVAAHKRLKTKLNDDGVKLANELKDEWQVWTPTDLQSSGGTLTTTTTGGIKASGTLPIDLTYTLTMPVINGLSAMKLDIHTESDDPAKWPERAAVLSMLTLETVSANGTRSEVKLREVVADYLAGPFDPKSTLSSNGDGFGGYPVLSGPRWCVILLDVPLKVEAGARLELKMKHTAKGSGLQAVPLRHFSWSASSNPRWNKFTKDNARRQGLNQVKDMRIAIEKLAGTKVPVMVERCVAARRPTRIFIRGNRLTPGDFVQAGIPAVSRPPAKQADLTRLDMALWLVSKENTLTARVLANRLWSELFGRGIVSTLEDFGSSGASPSHPELLDHLALRLVNEHHWSIKSFLRELVLSATYGQSSAASATMIQRDAANALLAHGPRVRLTAEMVRDQALVLSGLFEPKLFGPPVFPPQPESVWSNSYNGMKWETSTGPDRYRRALYVYHKRTSAYPVMMTFDAPARDSCIARRITTNTPLQALVTLNDPAFIELAASLAQRMVTHGGSLREQIAHGCRLLTLSVPSERMVDTLVKLHTRALAEPGTDATKAMLLVANTLLNTDAALAR